MYKEDFALNNLQWLICHKTQPTNIAGDLKGYHFIPGDEGRGQTCFYNLIHMCIDVLINQAVHLIGFPHSLSLGEENVLYLQKFLF